MSGAAVSSHKAIINSLASGATDFAVLPQTALLQAAAANAKIKAVAINNWGSAHLLVVNKNSAIENTLDLKGKSIALIPDTDAIVVLARLLNANDIDLSDVTLKYYEPGSLGRAFGDGMDAAIAEQPIGDLLLEQNDAQLLLNASEISDAIGYIGAQPLIASPHILANDEDTVAAVKRAWSAAKAHIMADPDDAARLLRIFLHRRGITIDADQSVEWIRMQHYDLDVWDKNVLTDAYYNAWALTQANLIKETPQIDQYLY